MSANPEKIVTARGDNPDYTAPWLVALGVVKGEWFTDTKHRAKRAMKGKFFSPAARIHICLGLHTMGFQQELAVKMVANKRVPLTPSDVCNATGIRREHFRKYMGEVEAMGFGECVGTTKGQIEIYSWAVPRPVDKEKIVTARGDNPEIVCEDGEPIPDAVLSALKHYRIRGGFVATRGDIAEIEHLARVTKEAELSLRARVDGLRAQQPYKRKKETERNVETNERPFVPSPSPVKEKLRAFLAEFPGRFGLLTLPDDRALDAIAAHLPNDGVLWRFTDLVTRQKPKPKGGGWMYFVPLAISCEQAWQADEDLVKRELAEQQAKAERWRREAEANPEPEIAHIVEIDEKVKPPVDAEREAGAAAVRAARAAELRAAKERRMPARREAGSERNEDEEQAKGQG